MQKLNIARYKRALEQKAAQVSETLRLDYQAAGKGESQDHDHWVLSNERTLGLLVMDRDREVLEEIYAALARLVDGEYGLCQICEEQINQKRLNAIPWTRRCIGCQEKADGRMPHGQRRRAA